MKNKIKVHSITHNAFIALYFLLCLSGKNNKYALVAGCEWIEFCVLFFCALTIYCNHLDFSNRLPMPSIGRMSSTNVRSPLSLSFTLDFQPTLNVGALRDKENQTRVEQTNKKTLKSKRSLHSFQIWKEWENSLPMKLWIEIIL